MNSIILYSRRAYSLEKHCSICTWHEYQRDINIKYPSNHDVRIVDAELHGRNLTSEFNELSLSWSQSNEILDSIKSRLPIRHGLSDYCVYFPSIQLAIVLYDHRRKNISNEIIVATSIEDLKSRFDETLIKENEQQENTRFFCA